MMRRMYTPKKVVQLSSLIIRTIHTQNPPGGPRIQQDAQNPINERTIPKMGILGVEKPSAVGPALIQQLTTPDEMRSYLADRDGKWLGRSWEDVLQRMPTSLGSDDTAVLASCHEHKNVNLFMHIYTPAFNECLVSLTPKTAKDKQAYFENCVRQMFYVPIDKSELPQFTGWVSKSIFSYDGSKRHFFAMTGIGRDRYSSRYLGMPLLSMHPRADDGTDGDVTGASHLVTVLAGESGSGKTELMLHTENGLYFVADDFSGADADLGNDLVTGMRCEPGTKEFRDNRNQRATQILTDKIVAMLRAVTPHLRGNDGDLKLVIALDEMVTRPNLVRGLCASIENITAIVKSRLCFEESHTLTLTFVAAGTGMDTQSARPGSLPGTYRVLTMAPSDEMPMHLVKAVKEMGRSSCTFLAEAIETSPDAQEATKNPRFAAALYHEIQRLDATLIGSLRSAESALRFLLQQAANKYKTMNGMSEVPTGVVRRIYQSALGLVFSREDSGGAKAHLSDEIVDALVGKFGVVRDRARWHGPSNAKLLKDNGYVQWRAVEESFLMSPPFRFEMSTAQQLLFRMHYGVHALPDATWQGYEVLIANYLEAAALGCHGCTLKHLLTCLNPSAKWHTQPSDDRDERLLKKKLLAYNGVVALQSNKRITGDTPAASLTDIDALVKANRAVVVINADKSSFADVILIIPDTALVLVQCKFYKDTTPLSEEKIKTELAKVSNVEVLRRIAGGANAVVVPVIATTKNNVTETTHDYLLWTTSEKDCLAPLATVVREDVKRPPARVELDSHDIGRYHWTDVGGRE